MRRVLVLGGYGAFGRRIVTDLATLPLHLIVAGRDARQAAELVGQLESAGARLHAETVDIGSAHLASRLGHLAPWVVVDTCGPFQGRDYAVARACAQTGAHYIDLADGRDFVAGFGAALDGEARARGVTLVSGASSVPGISSATVDQLGSDFSRIDAISIGIAPGNRTDPGPATTQAILGYVGKPIDILSRGAPARRFGWMGTRRHAFPEPVGLRRLADCDVPDLELFGPRYGAASVRFRAGQELAVIHYGLVLMAWLARVGLVRSWAALAPQLHRAAQWLKGFGTADGGMFVRVGGLDDAGLPRESEWTLTAAAGYGPEIPTLPARILVRKWLDQAPRPGARPCLGEFGLDELESAADHQFVRTWTVGRTAPLVIYDGVCNLCNRMVDFTLCRDAEDRLYFTHCQSPLGQRLMGESGHDPDAMESVVLRDVDGFHDRSDAALRIAAYLSAPARWLRVLSLIPRGIRDAAYDGVAGHRYRWFGRRDTCRRPSDHGRRRFLDV